MSNELSAHELEEFINNGGVADIVQEKQKAQTPAPDQIETHLKGLDIKDPVELLMMLDEDLASGREKLYAWQIQTLMDFARGGVSQHKALHQLVRACNGSGKDKYIIAPCVVWLGMANIKARGVVTSSSGQQLDAQTGTYIDQLCHAANRKFQELFGANIWKMNYRYYECLATGSIVDLFATDEPKKAEGYHPLQSGAKMGIFVSEDKTVPDDINGALSRCSGYTHRLHVSTPGEPMGHFYDYHTIAVPRKEIKDVLDIGPIDWVEYHVTAYDCGHLGKAHADKIERESPGGKEGAYFKSVIMAEFGTVEAMVVIPSFYVWKAVKGSVFGHKPAPASTAGLDLSDGGDETVLSVRNGNRQTHLIPFRFDNTEDTVRFLDEKFRELGLNNPASKIYADCGGLGKPILDRLKGMGWTNIHFIDNRSKPSYPKVYKNRGAELYFQFRKLMERNELWLIDDLKLKKQLATRFYFIRENVHQLQSKIDARAKGFPSPDRADATVLCFWDYEGEWTAPVIPKPFDVPEVKREYSPVLTLKSIAAREQTPSVLKPVRVPIINQTTLQESVAEWNARIRK